MMKVQQDIIGTSALNNKQMELNCAKDSFKTIFLHFSKGFDFFGRLSGLL